MTRVRVNGQEFDFDAVVELMDDALRNRLHDLLDDIDGRDASPQRFVDDYCVMHAEKFGSQFIIN